MVSAKLVPTSYEGAIVEMWGTILTVVAVDTLHVTVNAALDGRALDKIRGIGNESRI